MGEEFICKYCGAPLPLQEAVGGVVRCTYCGNVQTLPKKDVSPAALSFLRMGEHDLDTCKFDEAYTAYAKAAELDSEEPEAYFGMALAAFKVQYLKDEVNERLQPICHEISEKVFSGDRNFRRALELATNEQKREYLARAEEIAHIRKEFYDLKASGLDYDCFLCVKVTDGGGKTADHDRANEIYYYLKDRGHSPFFSEREMRNRTGSDYEALILYALYTSECMLIVCSDEEYLQTKWVKNEYTRFLHMLANEEKERDALTFVFSGKPVEKLPNGKKVQGIDLSKPDAYTRIEDFVQTHTPEAKKRREEERSRKAREEEESKRHLSALEEELKQLREAMMRQTEEKREERQQELLKERSAKEEEERKRWETEERKRRETQLRYAEQRRATEEAERKAREEEIWNAQFEIEDGVLKKYKGKGGDVVIPESITSIGPKAFSGCSGVTGVTIGESVTSIGGDAFAFCGNLKTVTVPDLAAWCRIEFGNMQANPLCNRGSLFVNGKKVTELTVPAGVTAIKDYAFAACGGLNKAVIPDSVTSIGEGAFGECFDLADIALPDSVTSIGAGAFFRCLKLADIRLPAGIREIGEDTFMDCMSLLSVAIPEGVTEIGESAFAGSGLESIVLGGSLWSVGEGAFQSCEDLTSVTVGDSMRSIGAMAFLACSALRSIDTNKVTSIGSGAFAHCSALESVTVPNRSVLAEDGAFGLQLDMGGGIGEFYEFTDSATGHERSVAYAPVRTASVPAHVLPLLPKDKLQKVTVTGGETIGEEALLGCTSLGSIVLPESVTVIEDRAFSGCSGVKEIALPVGVTEIGEEAFKNSGLEKITLPKSVSVIGEDAFAGCAALAEVTLENGVQIIGKGAFADCNGLTAVTVPESVLEIGVRAFEHCTALKEVSMPKRLSGLFGGRLKKIFGDLADTVSFRFTKD